MSEAPHLLLERHDAVTVLTLNRPQIGNAISPDTAVQLAAVLEELESDPHIGALVVTGAGDRAFCTGGDLTQYGQFASPAEVSSSVAKMQANLRRLSALPVPVIAALNGRAIGGGFELAVACDLRVAQAGVEMTLPQARMGLTTGWCGLQRLQDIVGYSRAFSIFARALTVKAEEAYAWGLVDAVTAGPAREGAIELAEEITAHPAAAVRAGKRILQSHRGGVDQATEAMTMRVFTDLWFGDDHRATQRAFAKRRVLAEGS